MQRYLRWRPPRRLAFTGLLANGGGFLLVPLYLWCSASACARPSVRASR